jgi:hypothetical protein
MPQRGSRVKIDVTCYRRQSSEMERQPSEGYSPVANIGDRWDLEK